MWKTNNYLIEFLQQHGISRLKEEIKIVLLGDYHCDAGISIFLNLQKHQLLRKGYKTLCLESQFNITSAQQHMHILDRLEELKQQNPYDNDIEMKLEKKHSFELQTRLNLIQFNIKFIDPSTLKCTVDEFAKKFALYSISHSLREEGMALLILKSAIDTNNGVIAQVGLDHFLSVYKKLRTFYVEVVPIIPFNDFRMVLTKPPAKQIAEVQQNLIEMWASKLHILHCDRECLEYTGRIEHIEHLEEADQYLKFERNDENNIIVNRVKRTDCFISWNLEDHLNPSDSLLWCAPPLDSKIINGITIVPTPVIKRPSPW